MYMYMYKYDKIKCLNKVIKYLKISKMVGFPSLYFRVRTGCHTHSDRSTVSPQRIKYHG